VNEGGVEGSGFLGATGEPPAGPHEKGRCLDCNFDLWRPLNHPIWKRLEEPL
jgi:hypothetical protein